MEKGEIKLKSGHNMFLKGFEIYSIFLYYLPIAAVSHT